MLHTRHCNRGSSLVEMLVSLLFFAIFATVVQQFSRSMLRGVRVLELASEAQEAARIGVQSIVRDLRGAGFSPKGSLASAVRRAAADAVEVASDLNGDGDTSDANERVGYSLDATKRALLRQLGGGAPQPMLADLAPGGLAFVYFGPGGTRLADPAADAGLIRRIDVRLAVEVATSEPIARGAIRVEQTGSAFLRNRE